MACSHVQIAFKSLEQELGWSIRAKSRSLCEQKCTLLPFGLNTEASIMNIVRFVGFPIVGVVEYMPYTPRAGCDCKGPHVVRVLHAVYNVNDM